MKKHLALKIFSRYRLINTLAGAKPLFKFSLLSAGLQLQYSKKAMGFANNRLNKADNSY